MKSEFQFLLAILCSYLAECHKTNITDALTEPPPFRRIAGGELSEYLPFYVLIKAFAIEEGKILSASCGGSIISHTAVLTAAHCIDQGDSFNAYNEIKVLYGSTVAEKMKALDIKSIIIHKDFDFKVGKTNDIAVIFLKNKMIEFIETSVEPPPWTEVWAAGFGITSPLEDTIPLKLKKGKLVIRNCRELFGVDISHKLMCAKHESSTICSGDSGGPLYYVKDGKNVLIGITKAGGKCEPGYAPTFVRISEYSEWIIDAKNYEDFVFIENGPYRL